MNFYDYKNNLGVGGVHTNGQRHSFEAQGIIEHTWYDDPASMVAYFYDYDHDDEKDKNKNLHPELSKTKIPVDIKYIISAYRSMSKDEVDLRIMFKPSYECTIPYYQEKIGDVAGGIFPVGLYCDIKDENGIWNKWLVVATASLNNHDFPTWAILPCGYRFQWMHNGKKMQMWGVERSQNSYNSGVWRDYKTEVVNDLRFIVATLCRKSSLCWESLRANIPKRKNEINLNVMVKKLLDWVISREALNRRTFNEQATKWFNGDNPI